MKRILFILLISCFCKTSFSQKQNNNWYFGGFAGVTFNSGIPVALTNGLMYQAEGSAVMSDNNGNLLFFTDGVTVWNRNLDTMPNGKELWGNYSATQSALIVPQPGNCNIYYIFTVPADINSQDITTPMAYSVVDMSLDGGLGDISTKNTPLYLPVTEKLTGTLKSNGTDYWVMAHAYNSNSFLAYSVTSTGVDTIPIISNSGPVIQEIYPYNNVIGYMKFSPDGSKLCYANIDSDSSQLFDFDNATGEVSNDLALPIHGEDSGFEYYGLEFSPDNSKLYIATWPSWQYVITQFDLSAGSPVAIQNSATQIINRVYNADSTKFQNGGALELGPNGKIYSALYNQNILAVINQPNLEGTLCDWADTGVLLNNKCLCGLPNNIKQLGSTSSCSLPVDLLNFTATSINNTVKLQWQTTNEINSDYFTIERSSDGLSFSGIGKVNAAGNSNGLKQYEFIDQTPLSQGRGVGGEAYYRLKEVDLDGNYKYSNILLVKMPQVQPLIIMGNPVQNNLQINIASSQTNYLSIFDFTGRRLNSFTAQSGVQNIDVSSLTAGTYVLQMITADGQVYDKVFVKGK
jgi:hypothetical protein